MTSRPCALESLALAVVPLLSPPTSPTKASGPTSWPGPSPNSVPSTSWSTTPGSSGRLTTATQDPAEIEQTLTVNLVAPMLLTRAVLPAMRARRQGHVVNIVSAAGKSGTPFEAAYSASKFGLVGFTHALRGELDGTGVGCSVICPGFIADDGMYARFAESGLKASPILGVSKMHKVTEAVVDAIRKNRAEIIVNPTPLRPVLMVDVVAPGLHPNVMKAFGVTRLFKAAAEMRNQPT